jgi:peptidoglycan/LPS O-acetylase OafA/YrhL
VKNRILPLDGWRTIASLGVVWIHAWTMVGNPALNLFGINVFKPLAIVGNGVDFFFVISGFCLYLILKDKPIKVAVYITFIKNRWLRIGPAFYICAIISLFIIHKTFGLVQFKMLLTNLFYLSNIIPLNGNPNSNIVAPFWSLAVEFQFYILLPFMLMASSKIGIKKTLYILFALGLVLNFLFTSDENQYQLVTKICHFTFGIFAAVIFLEAKPKPEILTKWWGAIIGAIVCFAGRYFMSDAYANSSNEIIKSLTNALAPVLLTGGFTLLMLNSISSISTGKWLANPVLQFYGKISYSIYLWHYTFLLLITPYVINLQFASSTKAIILFLVELAILTPIAYASYYFIEKLYLNKKK